jgi:hypothetical protein
MQDEQTSKKIQPTLHLACLNYVQEQPENCIFSAKANNLETA